MHAIVGYHRPESLEEALALVNRGSPRSVVLAGGTWLNATPPPEPVEMIDLQEIGLDTVRTEGTRLEIGAMARLAEVATDAAVPSPLRELVHREGPNTLRNAATVGGTIAIGHRDSEFVAGCLVYEAQVTLARPGGLTETVTLEDLLSDRSILEGAVITSLLVETGGEAAVERIGRTPADTSIVAAVARRTDSGNTKLALTGMAPTPIVVTAGDVANLDPTGDFRGSGAYRRHLAGTLVRRALDKLGEKS